MFNQVSILRAHIYKAANHHGADFRELCKRMKITPEQLADGEGVIPFQMGEETDFWTHAIDLTEDPMLGLHMGQTPDVGNPFGMLGMLAGSSKNLQEALEMICKFNDTLTGVFKFTFRETSDEFMFFFEPHTLWEETNLESARQAVDMFASSLFRSFRDATGKEVVPLRITLKYSKRFVAEYQRILKVPIIFEAERNCLIFSKVDLQTHLFRFDQSLFALLHQVLEERLEKFKKQKSLSDTVRHQFVTKFNGQVPNIDIIASQLCMTTRTLQRKLADEGTSYRTLANTFRKELAEDLLRIGKSKKKNIALILGFSDTSAFRKAMGGKLKI